MTKVRMMSIEGLDHCIVGVGLSASGNEVLVYDGRKVEEYISVTTVLAKVQAAGQQHNSPLFVFFDEDVRGEVIDAIREPEHYH
jgi:hypothetical protein